MPTSDNVEYTTAVLEQEFVVPNKLGLHARVAARIVSLANQFQANVWFIKDGIRVDAKSILDLLTLNSCRGTKLLIVTEGPDAADVMQALASLFQTKFGEE
jgi:phosphocarrier protein HPr